MYIWKKIHINPENVNCKMSTAEINVRKSFPVRIKLLLFNLGSNIISDTSNIDTCKRFAFCAAARYYDTYNSSRTILRRDSGNDIKVFQHSTMNCEIKGILNSPIRVPQMERKLINTAHMIYTNHFFHVITLKLNFYFASDNRSIAKLLLSCKWTKRESFFFANSYER